MNISEVLKLKFPEASFMKDIILQDDGQGAYIKHWDASLGTIPSATMIGEWAVEVDLLYRQQQAVGLRQYPSIGDQLDMLYKDAINNTSTWKDHITAIKMAHPKPSK